MPSQLTLRTTVLPGNRVEFSAPELPEGAEVEISVTLPGASFQPMPRNEGIAEAAAKSGLKSVRYRKVSRSCLPCDLNVCRGIKREGGDIITVRTSKIG